MSKNDRPALYVLGSVIGGVLCLLVIGLGSFLVHRSEPQGRTMPHPEISVNGSAFSPIGEQGFVGTLEARDETTFRFATSHGVVGLRGLHADNVASLERLGIGERIRVTPSEQGRVMIAPLGR